MEDLVNQIFETVRSTPELMTETAAKDLVTQTIDEAYKKECQEWYDAGKRDSDGRASLTATYCFAFVVSLIVISITYVTLLHERQERENLAACSKGEYTPCIEGWLLNVNLGRSMTLQAHEDAYFNSTGKPLISEQQKQLKVKHVF